MQRRRSATICPSIVTPSHVLIPSTLSKHDAMDLPCSGKKLKTHPRCGTASGCSSLGAARVHHRWMAALQQLFKMEAYLLKPTTGSLRSTIISCSKQSSWPESARLLFLGADIDSCNALMHAQGRCDAWQQAELTMQSLAVSQVRKDIISYNTIMAACSRHSWQRPLHTLSSCLRKRMLADVVTFSTAINTFGEVASWQAAINLFCLNVRASAVACSAALKTLRPLGRWLRALAVSRPFLEDRIVSNAFLGACQRRGLWRVSLTLLGCMLEPEQVTYTATFSACEAAYEWKVGLRLLRAMRKSRTAPDAGSQNAAISTVVTASKWDLATVLREEMRSSVLAPDSRTDAVTMNSVSKRGRWKQAVQLLMQCRGATGQVTYNSALSACENGCCWQMCLHLVGFSALLRLEVDDCGFNSATSGCAATRLDADLLVCGQSPRQTIARVLMSWFLS